jgi:hypothetical protein
VNANHIVIAKMFEKEVNYLMKGKKKKTTNKEVTVSSGSIFLKNSVKNSFKKEDVPQKDFFEDLGLLIVKNNLPMQFMESMWLKRLILCLCPKLNFHSKRQFLQEILPRLVEKTSQQYVFLAWQIIFLQQLVLIFKCLSEFMMSLH